MNARQSRMLSALENLTGQEQAVFRVVPLVEAWTVPEINTELGRQKGNAPDYRVTERCLQSLKEKGLIKRVDSRYTREGIPNIEERPKVTQQTAQSIMIDNAGESKLTALETLYAHADGIRAIIGMLEKLAQDIESTVLEVEELLQAKDQQSEKLAQFKRLLAEFSAEK